MQETTMNDLSMLLIAALFAASSWLLIVVSDALMGEKP
jgi:hypothetical protein